MSFIYQHFYFQGVAVLDPLFSKNAWPSYLLTPRLKVELVSGAKFYSKLAYVQALEDS